MTTTTVIQPSSADTDILNTLPTVNYGNVTSFRIGQDGSGNVCRSLLKFDLSSIPASELVASATLSLRLLTDAAAYDVTWKVYQVLRNWVETEATWNVYSTGNNWATAGAMGAGDINATEIGTSGTISNSAASGTEISITLNKDIVQAMRTTNYGFLLKSTTESSNTFWSAYSREHATTAYHPKLTIVSEKLDGGSVSFMSDYGVL
jgi:predicted transcriptional regulator